MIIDWTRGEMRPNPSPRHPDGRTMYYPAKCPLCRAEIWRRPCDLKRQKTCKQCAERKAGIGVTQGAAAARRFEGQARAYRRRPNRPERRLQGWLIDFGIPFQSQKVITLGGKFYILDFFLNMGTPRVLEVVGFWHKHADHVQRRDRELARLIEFPILFLDSDEIMNEPEIAKKRLLNWLTM